MSASTTTKIYIGNLPYSITESEISDSLSKYSSNIKSIEIPTFERKDKKTGEVSTTSKGYSFVELADLDPQEFIQEVGKLVLKERALFAKIALSEEELKEKLEQKKAKIAEQKKEKKQKLKEKKAEAKAAAAADAAAADASATTTSAAAADDGKVEEASDKTTTKPKATKKAKKPVPQRKRKTKAEIAAKLEEGTPSPNTVFINNLEESTTSKELREFFINNQVEPVFVNVPKRFVNAGQYHYLKKNNIPIKNNGIAFARFSDSDKQKEVIDKFNNMEFKGKNLTVSIAIDGKLDQPAKEIEADSESNKEN